MLREYADRGYTLATTEAGLVPFYSRWRTVDAWGLNDAWIAHHGGVTAGYLDRQRPHLIMFHDVGDTRGVSPWGRMVRVMREYAERNGYVCAAVYGVVPEDTHWYLVRPDFPDSAEILERIRSLPYAWYWDGTLCRNYALAPAAETGGTATQR
jgi:hypothetical protein